MRIAIIGTGNVATVLGKRLKAAGHDLLQVYGRTADHAARLATELGCTHTTDLVDVVADAELYLVAVNDDAIGEVAYRMGDRKGTVVHTAGSVSKDVLKVCATNIGVLYPLQSLTKERWQELRIPFLIDGNSPDQITLLQDLASSIGDQVRVADDAERLKMHLSAVIVNNFTNHLYSSAADYCEKQQLDFALLRPLILETAERVMRLDPRSVQTGPAARGDLRTIERHQQLLQGDERLLQLYATLTARIIEGDR